MDTPLQEIHDYFAKQLEIFPLLNEDIHMRVTEMGNQNILVEPADEKSAKRLEEIRTYVSEKQVFDSLIMIAINSISQLDIFEFH